MKHISNQDLLDEVNRRLSLNEKVIIEQQDMLSQLQDLNKKLEQSEALKSHFISNIKNEINNPLASILALSENLLRKAEKISPELVQSLRLIHNEAYALDFQLDNIMTAAEIEAGQVAPQMVDANVSQIIAQVILSFENSIDKKKLHIEVGGDQSIHFVTDSHFLKVIMANLISNAVKFSHEGDTVLIRAALSDNKLIIATTDNGSGISAKDMEKIFDRFTQLDSGHVKKYPGHGLGLSVIKSLVEILDGNVSVSSSESGSTFSISLPMKFSHEGICPALDDGNEILFDQSF